MVSLKLRVLRTASVQRFTVRARLLRRMVTETKGSSLQELDREPAGRGVG